MYKILVVALFTACVVNVTCLCGHLAVSPLVTTGLDPVFRAEPTLPRMAQLDHRD